MTDRFLAGRCALVTGATSGIGLAIANAFAAAGASVAISGLGDAGAGRRRGGAGMRGPVAAKRAISRATCAIRRPSRPWCRRSPPGRPSTSW
jgi:NAD(P)-dependent dehydrogenase (short-subunit alcohol dehydrogenase family)